MNVLQGTSAPEFATPLWNVNNCAFATNLEHLFATFGCDIVESVSDAAAPSPPPPRMPFNSTVKAWVYGHTHFNCSRLIHGTLVVSNQKGYELWGHAAEGGPPYRSDAVITV